MLWEKHRRPTFELDVKRTFMHMAAASCAFVISVLFLPITGGAMQIYPTRPITIVVPYTAGGSSDVLTRILADRMRMTLGRPVIVDNVSGATGRIGSEHVARAAPDGY